MFLLAAIALFWPALALGFLSDDYGMAAGAARWEFGPVTSSLFRPIPLLLWSVVLHLRGGAVAVHAINILLHGTNAFLTTRVAAGWRLSPSLSVLTGVLVLSFPLTVEPVAWGVGVFDLSATFFLLLAILAAQRYRPQTSVWARIGFLSLLVAALLSKETAAVAALIVGLAAWARDGLRRPLVTDIAIAVVGAATVSALRLLSAFGMTAPAITKYVVQRTLFETFGALAAPWHQAVLRTSPWLAGFGALAIVTVLALFAISHGPRSQLKQVAAAIGWIVIAITPVFPILVIAPDLEASRYLYLAAPAWALLLVIAASASSQTWRRATIGLLGCVGALGCVGVRLHLKPWRAASVLRDQIVAKAATNREMHECAAVMIDRLPDSLDGAYLFRNYADKAFEIGAGLRFGFNLEDKCRFVWDDVTQTFTRAR